MDAGVSHPLCGLNKNLILKRGNENGQRNFYEALNAGVEIYPLQFSLKNGEIFYKSKKISIILPK